MKIFSVKRPTVVYVDTSIGDFQVSNGKIVGIFDEMFCEYVNPDCSKVCDNLTDEERAAIITAAA